MQQPQQRALQQIARGDPKYLDVVTWAVLSGVRMFQRVQVTPRGLVAIERIPQYDFGCVVPSKATLSVLNVLNDPTQFPLKCSPANVSDTLRWWSDLSWGSFCFVAYLTRAMISASPRPVQMYLDVLPYDSAMPMAQVAAVSQRTKVYQELTLPLMKACRVNSADEFNAAFRLAYCLFRRHAVPFWAGGASGMGHPYFAKSAFVQKCPDCDLLGFVPIMDLATHSSEPNTVVGFPDNEMLAWLGQEKGIQIDKDSGYFVLQATRDIEAGELLTVNKNAFFNFDEATFEAWFGHPYRTASATPAVSVSPDSESDDRGTL